MFTLKTLTAKKPQKVCKFLLDNVEGLSFSALRKILRAKDVKVNGKRVSTDVNLLVGDQVEIYYRPLQISSFTTIYKDDNVLVVDKKSGFTSELVYEEIKKEYQTAGFIHRLDRNTSGLMIFSLNEMAEKELLDGFKTHAFSKKYLATVYGTPKTKSAVLTAYLVKNADTSTVKIFSTPVKGSVQIKTGYEVVSSDGETSVLEVTLYTGKTHQIRAHLAFIGHFIVGDGKYGDNAFNKSKGVKTQMLKAHKLTLKFQKSNLLYYLDGKTFSIN